MPTSTLGETINTFKSTGVVMNLAGSEFNTDCPHTLRRLIRVAKVLERLFLQICSRSIFESLNLHKCKHQEFTRHYWNFDLDWILWSDINRAAWQYSRWVWHKKKKGYIEKSLILTWKSLPELQLCHIVVGSSSSYNTKRTSKSAQKMFH